MSEQETSIVQAAFNYFCNDNQHICRLCLLPTKPRNEVNVDDIVVIKQHYCNETLTYLNIFTDLSFPIDFDLPTVICRNCAAVVVNSYIYKRLCKYSNEKWANVMDKFESGLKKAEFVKPVVQSLFLVVENDQNTIYTTHKSTENTKESILNRIRSIVRNRDYYIKNIKQKNKVKKEVGRHKCSKCSKTHLTQANLQKHLKRIHHINAIKCQMCNKAFSSQIILKNHEQIYHQPVNCNICGVEFPSRHLLRIHLDTHEDNTCKKCNKSYANKTTYKFHLTLCENPNKKPCFFCDICGKSYLRKNSMRSHIKVDHGFGNVFKCVWCEKKYDAISKLNNHIVKHTKERKFTCEICGGKFVTQPALIYHRRLHTGEKPFPCDLCGESFLSSSRRMEHKHKKHGKPTKECYICHGKFFLGNQLKKHIERHFNPKSKLYIIK